MCSSDLLGDPIRGEDVVQDCVCRLLACSARYDLEKDGRKLLFRSITNACLNHQSRAREVLSLHDVGRGSTDADWQWEDKAAHSPLDLAIGEELRATVAEGLRRLPIRLRCVLELSSLGHRPLEIAEMIDAPPEHVRVMLFRARQSMADFLNARSPGEVVP